MSIPQILLIIVAVCTVTTACSLVAAATAPPTPTPVPVTRVSDEYTYLPETLLDRCRDAATLAAMPEGPDRFLMASYVAAKKPCPLPGTLIRIIGDVHTTEPAQLMGLSPYPPGSLGLKIAMPFGQNQWGETDTWLIDTGAVLLGMPDEGIEMGDSIAAFCTMGQPAMVGMNLDAFELHDCELELILSKAVPTPGPEPYVWASERDEVTLVPTVVPTPTMYQKLRR